MAFEDLALTYLQSNDAETLQLTDATGTAATGWNVAAGTLEVTDIDNVTYGLELDVVVTTSDGIETTYDTIDLFVEFGGFLVPGDLVFEITADMLISSSTAMGDAGDPLDDGIYNIGYKVTEIGVGDFGEIVDDNILADGTVRIKIYDNLREVGVKYDCAESEIPVDCSQWLDIRDAILKYSLFYGMLSNVSLATEVDVLDLLDTLERLTVND